MQLVGSSQSTFSDMVSELGLSAAMKPETEYTLLAPLNNAFTGDIYYPTFTCVFSCVHASVCVSVVLCSCPRVRAQVCVCVSPLIALCV